MGYITAVILGIVLGITEFLPISSLGHSIVLLALFNFPQNVGVIDPVAVKNARDSLAIFVQLGAVLAVLVYYWRDLLREAQKVASDPKARQFWINIIIAFIPIGILGLLFNTWIKDHLFSSLIVGLALIVGGVIFLIVEQTKHVPTVQTVENITFREALLVGIAQIVALIPGVSRSGATIIGGMLAGLDRTVATVFTFYLFIPTLGAAAGYELYKLLKDHAVDKSLLPYFAVAAVVGFIVSLGAIRFLLNYISKHDFRIFGIYRIVIGVIIIALVVAKVIS